MFGQKGRMAGTIGHTPYSYGTFGSKYGAYGSNRPVTIPAFKGRGDVGGGQAVAGNTHNAVSNAQRDGAPSDMRSAALPGKRKVAGPKLESKKKNKGE